MILWGFIRLLWCYCFVLLFWPGSFLPGWHLTPSYFISHSLSPVSCCPSPRSPNYGPFMLSYFVNIPCGILSSEDLQLDINLEPETIKLHKENIVSKLGNDFLNRTPLPKELRPTIYNQVLIKLKRLCTAKEKTINRVMKKLTEEERFLSSYTPGICKTQIKETRKTQNLIIKETNDPIKMAQASKHRVPNRKNKNG